MKVVLLVAAIVAVTVPAALASSSRPTGAITLSVSYDLTGRYGTAQKLSQENYCGVGFHEVAYFDISTGYNQFVVPTGPKPVFAKGHVTNSAGRHQWAITGSFAPENDCSQPAQPLNCGGATAAEALSPGASLKATLLVITKGGRVSFYAGTGATGVHEQNTACLTAKNGANVDPYLGLADATAPFMSVVGTTTLAKLRALRPKQNLIVTAVPVRQDPDYDPDSCNHTPGCTGQLTGKGTLFIGRVS